MNGVSSRRDERVCGGGCSVPGEERERWWWLGICPRLALLASAGLTSEQRVRSAMIENNQQRTKPTAICIGHRCPVERGERIQRWVLSAEAGVGQKQMRQCASSSHDRTLFATAGLPDCRPLRVSRSSITAASSSVHRQAASAREAVARLRPEARSDGSAAPPAALPPRAPAPKQQKGPAAAFGRLSSSWPFSVEQAKASLAAKHTLPRSADDCSFAFRSADRHWLSQERKSERAAVRIIVVRRVRRPPNGSSQLGSSPAAGAASSPQSSSSAGCSTYARRHQFNSAKQPPEERCCPLKASRLRSRNICSSEATAHPHAAA